MTLTSPLAQDPEPDPGPLPIWKSLVRPTLLRALSLRMIAVSLVALLVLAVAAFALSRGLIESRFRDEASFAAGTVRTELGNRVVAARRAAALVAGLPGTIQLTAAHLQGAPVEPALLNYLRFAKAKLAVDLLNVADGQGAVYASTQDLRPNQYLADELVRRSPIFEQAFVIRDEAEGVVLRAIAPVRLTVDDSAPPAGFVEDGVLLDSVFLGSLNSRSDVGLALVFAGRVQASTVAIDPQSLAAQPSNLDLEATPGNVLTRRLVIGNVPYLGVFSLERSHSNSPLVLLVLVPMAELEAAQRSFALLLGLLIILIGLLVVPVSAAAANAFISPLHRLAGSARRVARGDPPVPIDTYAPHEIGTLERAFESMNDAIHERDRDLRNKNAELERVNRLKGEFLANVSHELRTPMNAIIGYSGLLLEKVDGDLNAEQEADLRRVSVAAQRLLSLINELLDVAKIESGKLELASGTFDLSELVTESCELLRPTAEAKSLALRSSVLPGTEMFADRTRIRQVLLNLLANALKFTAVGSVTVTARADDQWVTVSVIDTGIGVDSEQREYIFDEFRQGDASTTRRYGGTGLGLSICRSLVELHGGRIWVEATAQGGSRFSFQIPTGAGSMTGS